MASLKRSFFDIETKDNPKSSFYYLNLNNFLREIALLMILFFVAGIKTIKIGISRQDEINHVIEESAITHQENNEKN